LQVLADGGFIGVCADGSRRLHEKQAFCWETEELVRVPVSGARAVGTPGNRDC